MKEHSVSIEDLQAHMGKPDTSAKLRELKSKLFGGAKDSKELPRGDFVETPKGDNETEEGVEEDVEPKLGYGTSSEETVASSNKAVASSKAKAPGKAVTKTIR